MKRYLPIIAIVLIFLIGLGVLTYPLISSVACMPIGIICTIPERSGTTWKERLRTMMTGTLTERFMCPGTWRACIWLIWNAGN